MSDFIANLERTLANKLGRNKAVPTTACRYLHNVDGTSVATVEELQALIAAASPAPFLVKTSTYTAAAGDRILTNTSGGAFTINLPPAPAVGDSVVFVDGGNNWATNNLTIGRNGSTIEGSATNLICNLLGDSFTLLYTGSTWRVTNV